MKTQENHKPVKLSKIILPIIGIIFFGFLLSVLIAKHINNGTFTVFC